MTESSHAPSKISRRRWFQFSLRTILVFTLLCALPYGWLAKKLEQANRQRLAVAAILKDSGWVGYDYQRDAFGKAIPDAEPPGSGWLRRLLGDDLFMNVTRAGVMTEAAMEQIHELPQLQDLDCSWVPNKGLRHLRGMNQLRSLMLGSEVTDAGLEHLAGLTQLKRLDLIDTQVTDVGLKHLVGMTGLEWLRLDFMRGITEAALKNLQGMPQLREVVLSDKNLTDARLKQLQQILPQCKTNSVNH